jgi:replicative DNA helicase Mcm
MKFQVIKDKISKGAELYEEYLRQYHDDDIRNLSAGADLPYELIIDYRQLEEYNFELADLLIDKSDDIIFRFQQALSNLNQNYNSGIVAEDIKVRFKNLDITPIRELTAENVGKLIQTKGVITNYTLGHQIAIKTAVFECSGCMRLHEVEQVGNKLTEPALCNECGGRSFRFLNEESEFVNQKQLTINEPIEELNGKHKQQPISATISGERDFIDKVNYAGSGGKKINIVGKLESVENDNKWYTTLKINNLWDDEDKAIEISDEDIIHFKQLIKDKDIIKYLIDSFAPDLVFDDEIKLALLCQRVGAADMGDNRKNINILIVGDRGTGKTSLSNRTAKLYEITKKSSGTGATGVGLLGATERDTINGGWTFEAGAIILADGGLIVIDEFDKINNDDQPKVNDLLQDGVTDIDKATVHLRVSADIRALALANPIGSKFDRFADKKIQIDIDESTFDRFDGVFTVLSRDIDEEQHREIRKKKYESYKSKSEADDKIEELKKYLSYVETEFNPQTNEESEKRGLEYHDCIYNSEFEGQRQSDSLDRFAGAIAKLRQHETIEREDFDKAFEIIRYMADDLDIEIMDIE